MIYFLKTDFHKNDMPFDEVYLSYIRMHFSEDEKFVENLPSYKSNEVYAFFTNKRIIFACPPHHIGAFGKTCELEFLPYKSIQRFMFLDSNTPNAYKLEVFLPDKLNFSFFSTDYDEIVMLSKHLGQHSC